MEARMYATYSLTLTVEEYELVKHALYLYDGGSCEMEWSRATVMLKMLQAVKKSGSISGPTT